MGISDCFTIKNNLNVFADILPTILEILQIPQPVEMTGKSLVVSADYEVRNNRTPVQVGM